MIVVLDVGFPVRVWHRELGERLEAVGHSVVVHSRSDHAARMGWAALVLAAERRLYRSRSRLFEVAAGTPAGSPALGDPQVRIVLAGERRREAACLEPQFDGAGGEPALLGALLQGRAPVVTIRSGSGEILAAGLPAIQDPLLLSRALDAVLSRLVTLLVKAVASFANRAAPAISPDEHSVNSTSAARFFGRGFAERLRRRAGPARGRPDHWRIAYRLGKGAGVAEIGAWPPEGFRTIPDDGTRFYADPFPFEEQGRRYIFFEDFPYATRKGVIGVVAIDAEGRASSPRTVLEAPVHLSYPLLLRERSNIYMLPEMSAAGCIQLFRADPFPDRWVPDRILIGDVVASDATLIRHEDRTWLFATLSDGSDSTWDQLGLFHAPSLFGPWTAHPLNPVLIDAGAARPAGAMWHEDGQLMRVAQDCRGGYGTGLAICRVDRLDPISFAQTVVRRLAPPDGFGAAGAHTLNRCGDLEVIDLRLPHRWRRR